MQVLVEFGILLWACFAIKDEAGITTAVVIFLLWIMVKAGDIRSLRILGHMDRITKILQEEGSYQHRIGKVMEDVFSKRDGQPK